MSTVSDLDTWRLFFKIVSRGSIAKVSEEIGVEASSISRRINKLEKDLGVELFQRKGKQLVLTSAGSLAYSRMRRIVFDAASLFKDLQVARDNDRDLITIACPIGLSEIIMPIAISKYLEFNPDVSVSMRSLSYVELMTSDAITSYDVMLSITPLNIPTRDSKLIAGISFMLAATPQYLNGLKYPIRSPRDLSEHPIFSFFSRNRERNMVLRKGSDYFPLHFHAHMRLNNPGGIKQVVMRSKGIGAYCPVYYYLDELANGTVCEVLPEWKFPVQQIYISRKDRDRVAVNRFVHWLIEYFEHCPGLVPPSYEGLWVGDFVDGAPV